MQSIVIGLGNLRTLGNPENAQVITMLRESDAYYAALYPKDSNHLLDVSALTQDNVYFYTASVLEKIVSFGALIVFDEYAEIKRMYVCAQSRGLGIGQKLLKALENQAVALGIKVLRLETGIKQPEALSLYTASGYTNIAPFGDYEPDPLSLFMEKIISQ